MRWLSAGFHRAARDDTCGNAPEITFCILHQVEHQRRGVLRKVGGSRGVSLRPAAHRAEKLTQLMADSVAEGVDGNRGDR